MKRRNKQLLAENEYVKELLAVLKENPSPSGRDFAEMVAHVGELENRLAEAVEELRTMRQELLQVQNRSLKAVLQRSCKTSVYKGYKRDKIEMRGDRAEISDFPLYLNTVAGGLDCRDQTIGGFSFVVKIYAVPVVEIIG